MRDTLTIGKTQISNIRPFFFETKEELQMQTFLLFSDIREATKQFQSVDICCGKKVHKYVGM